MKCVLHIKHAIIPILKDLKSHLDDLNFVIMKSWYFANIARLRYFKEEVSYSDLMIMNASGSAFACKSTYNVVYNAKNPNYRIGNPSELIGYPKLNLQQLQFLALVVKNINKYVKFIASLIEAISD